MISPQEKDAREQTMNFVTLWRRWRTREVSYPASDLDQLPMIHLGAAYLCDGCNWISECAEHSQCSKCGSQQVMPVESFIRRIK